MQLISILLVIVGILTLLSGAIVFFGSSKADRPTSAWYFLAATFSTIWLAAIAFFLTAKTDREAIAPFLINAGLISALLLDVSFLGYGAWGEKWGRLATLIFLVAALVISAVIAVRPDLLYSEVVLANTGNYANLVIGPLYFAYVGFFALIIPAILYAFFRQYRRARSRKKRIGGLVVLGSFCLASVVTLVTNLIMPMPFFNNWSMTWLGPLMLSIIILSVYYIVLRYKAINLSYTWLRIFSYVVVVSSIAIVYMVIFAIIFAALFHGSTPSLEVIVLNFIMILIFMALVPAMHGFMGFIRRLVLEQHPSHSEKTDKKEPGKKS